MTNRERVNQIIAEAARAARAKRPAVRIEIIGAGIFLGLPT